MAHYPYIIVGGGMTAASALKAIRSADEVGKVAIFSIESDPPYARPPLTKGLWLGKPIQKIWRKVDFPETDIFLETSIIRADTDKKEIEDGQGNKYQYDHLLFATGGTPRRLKFGGDDIIYYRTLADYYKTRQLSEKSSHFGIIGGGFIGCELAASLCQQGNKVTIIFPEDGLNWRIFPSDLSLWLNQYYMDKGVEVHSKENIENMQTVEGRHFLQTASGKQFEVDAVIAGIGIIPEVALAQSAGLEVDNGIVVNDKLQTSAPDVFAAGDVALFENPAMGKRLRVEHEDNSVSMGWTAGINMAGKNESYNHLPFFYSDMFDLGYEAVGDLDPSFEILADWAEPFKKGVLYYVKDTIVRGVLLWNVWKKVDAARSIVEGAKKVGSFQLIEK